MNLSAVSVAILFMSSSVVMAEDHLSGTWGVQDLKNAPIVVDAAVKKVSDKMNFATRLLNKSLLDNLNRSCAVWKLNLTETDFFWECYGHKAEKMAVTAHKLELGTEEGGKVINTFQAGDNQVATMVESEDIKRKNIWHLVSDSHMEYTTIIESVHLPEPITWTLLYKRH